MPSKSKAKSTSAPAPTPAKVSAVAKKTVEPVVVEKTLSDPPVVVKQQTTVTPTSSNSVTEQPETPVVESVTLNRIKDTRTKIAELSTVLKSLTKELLFIEKEYNKERNLWIRKATKKGRKSTSLSGFAKPGFISPELCSFLNVEAGTEMAHTDVTKHVINYIKDHSLQDEQNRRVIIPDKKLSGLLQPGTQDTITFFNLQTFMKHHYLNPNKPKVPAATVASTSLASN
jgi:chromatin remodeling complex protein RSC6